MRFDPRPVVSLLRFRSCWQFGEFHFLEPEGFVAGDFLGAMAPAEEAVAGEEDFSVFEVWPLVVRDGDTPRLVRVAATAAGDGGAAFSTIWQIVSIDPDIGAAACVVVGASTDE